MIVTILIIVGIIILSSIRQINEYERGIKFTCGKFSKILNLSFFNITSTYLFENSFKL